MNGFMRVLKLEYARSIASEGRSRSPTRKSIIGRLPAEAIIPRNPGRVKKGDAARAVENSRPGAAHLGCDQGELPCSRLRCSLLQSDSVLSLLPLDHPHEQRAPEQDSAGGG